MTEDEAKQLPHYKKVNPLDGLPQYLKTPESYEKVQHALLDTLACGKLHSDPSQMFHCQKCTENMVKRRNLMTKLGFKSPAQYMAWRKTHEAIKKRVPYPKYNS